MGGQSWVCVRCGKEATREQPFGFQPFKNFPAAPDCPYCFTKKSMQIVSKKKDKTEKKVRLVLNFL